MLFYIIKKPSVRKGKIMKKENIVLMTDKLYRIGNELWL